MASYEAAVQVAGLFTHPIKGCRPISLQKALITKTGLRFDREWMVVRADTGRFISQREIPKLALVVPQLPPEVLEQPALPLPPGSTHHMTLTAPGMTAALTLPLALDASQIRQVTVWEWTGQAVDIGEEAAQWFTSYLGLPCRLVRYVGSEQQSAVAGAAGDDAVVSRPTDADFAQGYETSLSDGFPMLLASESSLADLNARLASSTSPGASLVPLPITRFRPNLVVRGLEPWAEDLWRTLRITGAGAAAGEEAVELTSVKPCSRCKVTTIDPATGVPSEGEPLDILSTFRKGSHLSWSVKSWKHAVHFGWNLVPTPGAIGRVVCVGDSVAFSEAQKIW